MPAGDSSTRFSHLIESMARPNDVRGLSLKGLHITMAMRICAVFEAAGRDPVPDLAQRYRSIEAACAVHGLVRKAGLAGTVHGQSPVLPCHDAR